VGLGSSNTAAAQRGLARPHPRDTLKASTPTIPGHNHNRALAGRRPTTKGSARRRARPARTHPSTAYHAAGGL